MKDIVCGHLDWCANELDNSLSCDCGADATRDELVALRRTLNSVRSTIRLVCNRDKITEWTMASLREAEAEIDVALRDEEKPRG